MYIPKPPYPKALESPGFRGKQGTKIQDMLDIFKHVQINLPLLDAIQQVSAYAKFSEGTMYAEEEIQRESS